MATVGDVALQLASICTTVPRVGPGVCDRCHGCPNPGWAHCWSCDQVEGQLSQPCELVVPISLYAVGHQLHYQLRSYKGPNDDLASDFLRKTAALLGYFLHLHSTCIAAAAGGGWAAITTVPSSADRAGEHPLVTAIKLVPGLRDQYEPLLVPGAVSVDHNVASDQGFTPQRRLDSERVLLVDDTFTSGARAQSAASAINNAGGTVAAIVPIGRVINPAFGAHVAEYWNRQTRQLFSFERCCVAAHGSG